MTDERRHYTYSYIRYAERPCKILLLPLYHAPKKRNIPCGQRNPRRSENGGGFVYFIDNYFLDSIIVATTLAGTIS